jgi:uncharacterized membrane protein YjjB (DUF3815 family)
VNSSTNAPSQKLTVGGLATALSVVILYLLATYAHFSPPPDITLALGALIGGAVYFIAGYVTPPAAKDTPVPAPLAPPKGTP